MQAASIADHLSDPQRNHLTLQRLILSSLVIVSHCYDLGNLGLSGDDDPFERWAGSSVSLGGWAVHAFFVISGYLMAESWSRCGSVKSYLSSRVLRIFPGYWMTLLVTAIVLAPLLQWVQTRSLAAYLSTDPSPISYVTKNFLLMQVQGSIGVVTGDQPFNTTLNSALWTLSWEFLGYLGIMVLGLLGGMRTRTWMIVLAFVSFYVNLTFDPTHFRFFYKLYATETSTRLPVFFLAGTCFWLIARRIRPSWWLSFGAVVVGLSATRWGWYNWVMPLAMPFILLGTACLFPCPAFLRRRDYSYGIYLYGFPIQRLLLPWQTVSNSAVLYCVVSWLLTMPLAVFSWHCVEKWALKLKRR